MWQKFKKKAQFACDILEIAMAVMAAIGLVAATIKFIPVLLEFIHDGAPVVGFMVFLEEFMILVIGAEFLKMLLRPNASSIIEVVVFVVARHMVIGASSAIDNLLSIIGISILLMLDVILHSTKLREEVQKKCEE